MGCWTCSSPGWGDALGCRSVRGIFHELVGETLAVFLQTHARLCGQLDSLAKQPGDGEEQRRKRKQGNYLKKDKTFVVLKIRSHIADTTFHGSGTELFQDDEWEGQRYCLEKYGGQKRAEGPWSTVDVVSICKVGSHSAACWGCGTPGKTAMSAWGGISAAVVTPGF